MPTADLKAISIFKKIAESEEKEKKRWLRIINKNKKTGIVYWFLFGILTGLLIAELKIVQYLLNN